MMYHIIIELKYIQIIDTLWCIIRARRCPAFIKYMDDLPARPLFLVVTQQSLASPVSLPSLSHRNDKRLNLDIGNRHGQRGPIRHKGLQPHQHNNKSSNSTKAFHRKPQACMVIIHWANKSSVHTHACIPFAAFYGAHSNTLLHRTMKYN